MMILVIEGNVGGDDNGVNTSDGDDIAFESEEFPDLEECDTYNEVLRM